MPKYHVFDCFDAPIDPGTEQVMTSGRPIHLTFVQNGENASQVFWFRPAYWRRIGRTLAEKKPEGAWIHHNADWGMQGNANPVVGLNLEAFFLYARNPEADTDALWRQRAGEMFGKSVAEDVLKAVDLLAEFPMNVTRITFAPNEGYTYGPVQPCDEEFAPDPWGVLGRDFVPPDWARGDVGRLRDYWDYLGEKPAVSLEALAEKVLPAGERCPLQVMQQVTDAAAAAVDVLTGLKDRVKPEARGILDGLSTSAHITREHTTMLLNSMRTARRAQFCRDRWTFRPMNSNSRTRPTSQSR